MDGPTQAMALTIMCFGHGLWCGVHVHHQWAGLLPLVLQSKSNSTPFFLTMTDNACHTAHSAFTTSRNMEMHRIRTALYRATQPPLAASRLRPSAHRTCIFCY